MTADARRRIWPWATGYALALAVLAYFGVTVDQTGNNENPVWAAFFITMAAGGFGLWWLKRRAVNEAHSRCRPAG